MYTDARQAAALLSPSIKIARVFVVFQAKFQQA